MIWEDKSCSERVEIAVGLTIGKKHLARADLIVIADNFGIPFKTFVEALEREHVIPFGTYADIMHRFKTVQAFRERVRWDGHYSPQEV